MHQSEGPRKAIPQPITSAIPASGGARAFVALAIANVALAFGPLFVRMADTGPVAAAFWRMALAAPVLLIAAIATRSATRGMPGGLTLKLPRARWWLLGAAGVAFALDLGSWHVGILHTTMANATLLGNCATFLFPIWGFLVARAWPSRTQGVALGLAAAGAALLMGRSYELDPRHLAGDLLCVFAGVLYATYFVLMSGIRRTMAPLPALALSSCAALLPLLGFAVALGETIVPRDWVPMALLAIVCQLIGQGCMIYALGKLSPLVIGLALLIQPVVAAAVGWGVYGERLGAPDLVGIAMVAAALVLVQRRPRVAKPATTADMTSKEPI